MTHEFWNRSTSSNIVENLVCLPYLTNVHAPWNSDTNHSRHITGCSSVCAEVRQEAWNTFLPAYKFLIGSVGLCAGKKTIADYLVKHHAFTHIYLARPSTASMNEKLAGESTISRTDQAETDNGETTYHFPDVETLIDFITKKWDQCWVTTDIWDEEIFETLSRRPFFLLVSVDAPLGLRWRRLKARYKI